MFVPAKWPNPRKHPWKRLVQACAIENQFFVVGANRVGFDGENECFGNRMVVDPNGEIIIEGGENEGLVVGEIDLPVVEKARSHMTFRIPSREPNLFSFPTKLIARARR